MRLRGPDGGLAVLVTPAPCPQEGTDQGRYCPTWRRTLSHQVQVVSWACILTLMTMPPLMARPVVV